MKKYIVFFTILLCAMQSISAAAPQPTQWGHITDDDLAALDQDPETLALAIQNSINVQKDELINAFEACNIEKIQMLFFIPLDSEELNATFISVMNNIINKEEEDPRSLYTLLLLIKKGAHLETRVLGDTPLIIAANHNLIGTLILLIIKGANVNAINNKGRTGLMKASKMGHSTITQLLIDNRARLDIQDNKRKTAMMLAIEYNNREIVNQLLPYALVIGQYA